jgi:aldehyde:ferredoxin oxidoreductase
MRESVKTNEWHLPQRVAAAPASGPLQGRKVDFVAMKRVAYTALGWDSETGKPLDSTIEELGLKELVG